jgi:SP family sugar:H+ symporter-like MFS transporter
MTSAHVLQLAVSIIGCAAWRAVLRDLESLRVSGPPGGSEQGSRIRVTMRFAGSLDLLSAHLCDWGREASMSDHGTWVDPPAVWTDEEVFEPGESRVTVIRLSLTAALGGFLFGYDSAVINGAVTAIQEQFSASAAALGFAVASALLGAAVGAFFAGRVADRWGRLTAMWVAAVVFLISAVGSGFASSLWMIVVFRVIGGVGVGVASVIAPTYIAEIAPARIRGRLGSLHQRANVPRNILAVRVDFGDAGAAGGSEKDLWLGLEAWRWMFLAMVVPAVLYGGLALTIPESPRYLVAKGRVDEASSVLRRVLGNIDLDAKVAQIKETLQREKRPTMRDLGGPAFGLLPIVWVGIGLSVFQQFVGINVIF